MGYKLTLTPEDREFFRLQGRKGGKRCNPFKGFGTGDNVCKFVFARLVKAKKIK